MAFVCWRPLAENPWLELPMHAVSRHLPPRPTPDPQAPGMFAFADPRRVSQVLTAAGWTSPRLDKLNLDLDIAAGRGLEQAVVQSTQIGAVNSWLRGQTRSPPRYDWLAEIAIGCPDILHRSQGRYSQSTEPYRREINLRP
jgi:hypothetical protein